MKNALIAITILFASLAHAGDITVEQLNELYKQNEEAYKTVTVGMTAEYFESQVDLRSWCNRKRKEVVTEVVPNTKYQVQITTTILNNECGDLPEGSVHEKSEWRNIKDFTVEMDSYLKRFELEGNIVIMFKMETRSNKQVILIREKLDVTQSQFYNSHYYQYYADGMENGYIQYTSSLLFRDGEVALVL